MMRTLIERSIEMKQDIYVCMIDYSKAFDKVQHEPFMEILKDLNIEGKSWRLIRNIYWEQSATIRYENELGTWKSIRRGLRQGCVLSPDGFSIYSERIMKKIEDMPGAKVGGVNINNVWFADDTALIANTEKDLQELVNKIKEESKLYGLSLNKKKTYTMVFSKKKEIPKCSIKIDGVELEQVKQFNYLGSFLTSDGRSKVEIDRRIGQAKSAFGNMTNILSNKKISIQTRLRTLKAYIWPIMKYACETWNIGKEEGRKIDSFEFWCFRRMKKISWTERKSNDEVLRSVGVEKELLNGIKEQQMKFFGHIVREGNIEELITTGRIEGTRDRGRQRIKQLDNIRGWLKLDRSCEVIHSCRDREKWRSMIAQAIRHGT